MIINIGLFVLQVVSDLIISVLLLRSYSLFLKVNIGDHSAQLAQFIFAFSDWVVLPLRRILPQTGRLLTSTILPAVAGQLIYTGLTLLARTSQIQIQPLISEAMLHLIHLIISGLMGILVLSVILSWLQGHSSFLYLMERFSAPLLNPIRRIFPLIGGLDLSPFIAMLLLQVLEKLLASLAF